MWRAIVFVCGDAEGVGGLDELALAQRHRLGPDDPREARPVDERDRDDHGDEARLEDADHDHGDEEQREAPGKVDQGADRRVGLAAEVAGDRAERHPDHDRAEGDRPGDEQRDADPGHDPPAHVAAVVVGSEQVPGAERRLQPALEVLVEVQVLEAGDDQDRPPDDPDDHEAECRDRTRQARACSPRAARGPRELAWAARSTR